MGMGLSGQKRLPNAWWAWQGLRRNIAYRRAYRAQISHAPSTFALESGTLLMRAKQAMPEAEGFGLLQFSDPDIAGAEAHVFWRPDLLAGALRVRLTPFETVAGDDPDVYQDEIVLSNLKTPRVLLDTLDGLRHILIAGERFWVQLYCDTEFPFDDKTRIGIRIDTATHGRRRLDTATQLLALHRASSEKLSLIGRRKPPTSVMRALNAYDIWHGFERPKGTLEDVAAMITGRTRMDDHWGTKDRNLRVQARRWIERGNVFVERGYLDLLTRKTL